MDDFDKEMLIMLTKVILGLVIFVVALTPIRLNFDSNGEHSGYITAVEQSGMLYQNYVIYFKTDNSSSQEDKYCIPEEQVELANESREANKTREQVTIRYTGVRGYSWKLCGYDQITSIERKVNKY